MPNNRKLKTKVFLFICLLVFKSLNNVLPDYIIDEFTLPSESACRSTKSTSEKTCFFSKDGYSTSLEQREPQVGNQLRRSIRKLDFV